MKAVRLNQWAQPVQIEDVPQPVPGSDEVLVRVRAAAINPFDIAVASGMLQFMASVPLTLGTDFAGEVVSVGPGIEHVKPGDAVFGMVALGAGTFAEYTIAKKNEVALKPKSFNWVQAAAVPLAALAAWQSLFDAAQLKSGERLFIHGASGCVGSFAIQYAKQRGVYVIGSAHADKVGFLKELGVDECINSDEQHFSEVVRDIDVAFPLVMADGAESTYPVVKPGGRVVTIISISPPQEMDGIRTISTYAVAKTEDMQRIADLIDAGHIKVFIKRTFPLEEAQAALEFKQQRSPTPGKVILTVD